MLDRHLTHLGPLDKEADVVYFESLLDHFRLLRSVSIREASGHIPWTVWKICFSRPRITSFSYDAGTRNLAIPAFPLDEVEATSICWEDFSYTTTTWREWYNGVESWNGRFRPISMRPVFAFEREWLSAIVLMMNQSIVSLTLPLESTPILAMAALPWLSLRTLKLYGRFYNSAQVRDIHRLLPSIPSVRHLSILAARVRRIGRPAFIPPPASSSSRLPRPDNRVSTLHSDSASSSEEAEQPPSSRQSKHPPSSTQPVVPMLDQDISPESLLPELRSLEIAFPDPMDDIFAIPMPHLTHLSLRDHPRFYHLLCTGGAVSEGPKRESWYYPLLLATEMLQLLKRLQLPSLKSLELVYLTPEEEDDELLSYVVDAFPCLEHIEVHRYRRRRKIATPHVCFPCKLSLNLSLMYNIETHSSDSFGCEVSADCSAKFGLPR